MQKPWDRTGAWGVCPSCVSMLLVFLLLSPSCGGWAATGLKFMSRCFYFHSIRGHSLV